MSITSEVARNEFIGNGVATSFPVTLDFQKSTHLKVFKRDELGVQTTLVLNTDYTVSSGNVILPFPLALNQKLIVIRSIPFQQEVDIKNSGQFFLEDIEVALDKIVMGLQQLREVDTRSLRLAESISNFDPVIPANVSAFPGATLIVDETGQKLRLGPTSDEILNAQVHAQNAETSKIAAQDAQAAAEIAKADTLVLKNDTASLIANALLDSIIKIRQEEHFSSSIASTAAIVKIDSASRRVNITGSIATTIHGIDSSKSRVITIVNNSTQNITYKHQSSDPGLSAADKIFSSKGTDLIQKPNTSFEFIFDAQAGCYVLNAGAGSGGGELITSNAQTIANNGTIAISNNDPRQLLRVNSTGGPVTLNTVPFGAITSTDPMELLLVADGDTDTVSFAFNDADFGCIGNFDVIELTKNLPIKAIYHPTTKRFYLARY